MTLLAQTVASFLVQTLPAIAPLMTAEGTVVFLLAGGGMLARFGPVRTLQIGALVLALATAIGSDGSVWALGVAALLIGIGYAPAAPAGSQILAETAPREYRTLIFSIKQPGPRWAAPCGSALCAGLGLARMADGLATGRAAGPGDHARHPAVAPGARPARPAPRPIQRA